MDSRNQSAQQIPVPSNVSPLPSLTYIGLFCCWYQWDKAICNSREGNSGYPVQQTFLNKSFPLYSLESKTGRKNKFRERSRKQTAIPERWTPLLSSSNAAVQGKLNRAAYNQP